MEPQPNQLNKGTGLRELKPDDRDFSLKKVFGAISLETVPDKFVVAEPLKIKNQGRTDCCVAFALTAVSEDQEGVILEPAYTFAQIKKIQGNWKAWGADIRDGCKAALKGFLEETKSPYSIDDGRNVIANWENWSVHYDSLARKHRKKSYFKVDGYDNRFNAFRTALWQNRTQKASILTGVVWRDTWTYAKQEDMPPGIVQDTGNKLYPHALKIFGQTKIDNKLYLMGQLSNGDEIGNKGIFYFSEEIVNKYFTYGAYQFIDIDPNEAKRLSWSWWKRIIEFLKNIIKLN